MKILIITQTVDTNDSVLGFFVRWIEEFSKNCEQVHVLALNVGEYSLPNNVAVHSLGKSEGFGKLTSLRRLISLSWSLRNEYDVTFTHMTPIQVAILGPFWRLLGKKVGLWYTHPSVDLKLRLATWFSHVIFTGSDSSFNIKTKKKNVMGQGVDPDFFAYKHSLNLTEPKLVVVGRISPIKHIENAVDALVLLPSDTNAQLVVVGGPLTESDKTYEQELRVRAAEKGVAERIEWKGALPASQMQKVLADCDIFVHTSLTHSADKVLPEAMSTGLFVVSSNEAYKDDLPEMCFQDAKPESYAKSIEEFLCMSPQDQEELRQQLRTVVLKKHSLANLVGRILSLY